MPTSGNRVRRGRGRPVARDRQPMNLAASNSRTLPEEAESQQQSSNKDQSIPTHSIKTEDKKSTQTTPSKRGRHRKNKPRGVGRKPIAENQAEETLCSSAGVSFQDTEPDHSTQKHKRPPPSKGTRLRSTRKKPPSGPTSESLEDCLPGGSSRNQVGAESEGENRVSETEGCGKDSSEVKIVKEECPRGDFSFDVFVDGNGIQRAHQATFVLPICVGSIAFWQGKRAPEKKCYRWAVYVRSPGRVDLSHIIKRVQFQLHPSFPQPERSIEKPPYELEEMVSIEFQPDCYESPIELTHSLKLYTTSEPSTKRPVVSEKYDEIVFSEPAAGFFQRVQNESDKKTPTSRYEAFYPNYDSHLVDDCMHRINLVRSKIRNEIKTIKSKAEIEGVEISLPDGYLASKGLEVDQFKKENYVEGERKEKKGKGPTVKKMRLILDAQNLAKPFRMESINPHRSARPLVAAKQETEMENGSTDAQPVEESPKQEAVIKSEPMEMDEKEFKVSASEMEESEDDVTSKSKAESKNSQKSEEPQFFEQYYEEVSTSGDEGNDNQQQFTAPQFNQQIPKLEPEVIPDGRKEEQSEEEGSGDDSGSSYDGMSDTQNANDYDIEDDNV